MIEPCPFRELVREEPAVEVVANEHGSIQIQVPDRLFERRIVALAVRRRHFERELVSFASGLEVDCGHRPDAEARDGAYHQHSTAP